MRGRTFASVVLVGTFVLAGCIGADSASVEPSAPGGGPGVASGPAQFDETTGGIEGVVTDVELVPVAGAIVGLLQEGAVAPEHTVATDEAGRFSLSHVPPGEHVLAASALGFQSSSKRVSVVAGAVAPVSIALEPVSVEGPYAITFIKKGAQTSVMFRLTPQCLYLSQSVPEQVPNRNLLKTCNGLRLQCNSGTCEARFVDELLEETNWRTIVAEMDWQPQSGATGRAYWFDIAGPNVSRQFGGSIDQADKRYWMQHQGKAPIQIRIDLPETLVEREIDEADWYSYPDGTGCAQSSCMWLYRTWSSYCDLSSVVGECGTTPVDYGFQNSATFTVYWSIFYIDPAPAGFTIVPDA